MEFIADLHVHSYLSRATAKNLNLEHVNLWAQLKGIAVVGTGDFTHPQWFSELSEKLVPAEDGLFSLKPEYAGETAHMVPPSCAGPVRFMLSVEISSIYKKGGKTRKVHNVILAPTLDIAEKINNRLDRIGNIASDGRPILGLDSKTLLEIVLETSEDAFLIPAHIWTPWFSVLGSKSGFDSIEECFEDLTSQIFAVETGLSADPAMNWRVSSLDGLTLVSNSDAHSPANLGREANLFDTDLSYFAMKDALKTGDPKRFLGTLEYFAEEGKYHFDGHRKCGVRLSPIETMQNRGLCPVCGKPVTIGVMYRVEELADRKAGEKPQGAHPYRSLLPLTDVLSEVLGVGPKSKKVGNAYQTLLERLGPEFEILRSTPFDALEQHGPALLAEAIKRMRENNVRIAPGYDGEFGTVVLFTEEERQHLLGQRSLFCIPAKVKKKSRAKRPRLSLFEKASPTPQQGHILPLPEHDATVVLDTKTSQSGSMTQSSFLDPEDAPSADRWPAHHHLSDKLNEAQQEAAQHVGGPLLIVAGPGTGKTRTLTHRIGYLLSKGIARPEQVLAVTFTNKAAREMAKRLKVLVEDPGDLKKMTINTFHGLCLDIILHEKDSLGLTHPVFVLSETDRMEFVRVTIRDSQIDLSTLKADPDRVLNLISLVKQLMLSPGDDLAGHVPEAFLSQFSALYSDYQQLLEKNGLLDFDDLIFNVVRLFERNEEIAERYRQRFSFVSVDEYQDINYGQYRLVRLLAPEGHDLCVIGDPDQAIYGFRGADVRFFHRFSTDYPDAKMIFLRQNYRSTETILRASGQVMSVAGSSSGERKAWSGIQGVKALTIAGLPTERAEAEYIIKTIDEEVGGISHFSVDSGRVNAPWSQQERSFSDFAVLYRVKEQVKALKEAFARSGIPFQNVGDKKLEDRTGIAGLISYIRVGLSVAADFDVERIVNFPPRGIGPRTVEATRSWCKATGHPFLTALDRANEIPGLGARARTRLMSFGQKLNGFREQVKGQSVCEQIQFTLDRFNIMDEMRKDKTFEESIMTLLALSRSFGDRSAEFLAHLALEKEQDLYDPRAETVPLMTMHASKGLEFPVVFIAGCENGLIPYRRGKGDDGSLEEERRLFYVALTRAKEKVYLTYANRRQRFGQKTVQHISPFLEAIEAELKQYEKPFCGKPTARRQDSQLSLFEL